MAEECLKNEIGLVLTFLEEIRDHGACYAEERLWQRWRRGSYRITAVGQAAERVKKKIEDSYSGERFAYLFVLGACSLAAVLGLVVCLNPEGTRAARAFACFAVPAAVICLKFYWGRYKVSRERQTRTRCDLDTFYKAFGGMLQL